jgi:hypothetical protein
VVVFRYNLSRWRSWGFEAATDRRSRGQCVQTSKLIHECSIQADDELMLFDALFDAWDTLESLFPENFSVSHNLPYTHGLGAGALARVIEGLIQRGLIRCRTEHGPPTDSPGSRSPLPAAASGRSSGNQRGVMH